MGDFANHSPIRKEPKQIMKISILTTSFNSGKYLERAINSVLNQNYNNWEHIIVDGGSTDGTLEILKKFPHLNWVSEPDKGQSDAMNKGFEMSTGDIIGYLNADDYYQPNIFQSIISNFKSSSEDMIVGDILIERRDGIEKRTPATKYREVIDYTKDLFPANPVSYFYRREVQSAYGEFPIDNHHTMDLDFIFYVYKYFKTKYLPLAFGTFFLDGDNKTSVMNVREEQRKALTRFLWRHDKLKYFINKKSELTFKIKKSIKSLVTRKGE
jgi:glycosyltransferase involved in cell wall biosynthesis